MTILMQRFQAINQRDQNTPDNQLVLPLTDPDLM